MIGVKLKWVALGEHDPPPQKKKKKRLLERTETHFHPARNRAALFVSWHSFFFFFKVHCGGTVFTRQKKKKTSQISHFRTKSLVFFSARRDDLNPTYPATRSQLSKPLPDKSAEPISQLKPRDIIFCFVFPHTLLPRFDGVICQRRFADTEAAALRPWVMEREAKRCRGGGFESLLRHRGGKNTFTCCSVSGWAETARAAEVIITGNLPNIVIIVII